MQQRLGRYVAGTSQVSTSATTRFMLLAKELAGLFSGLAAAIGTRSILIALVFQGSLLVQRQAVVGAVGITRRSGKPG